MRRNFIYVLMMLFVVALSASGQTYKLNDMTATEFEAGGNTQWSFERYTIATGNYSLLTTYGADGRINYFDRYNPERFAGILICQAPEVLSNPYPVKRNSWYDTTIEYVYVGRDYEDYTGPKGYEVYPTLTANSIITFKVPADGFYKVDMSIVREDNINIEPLEAITRMRLGGESQVAPTASLGFNFYFGAGGNSANPEPKPENPSENLRFDKQQVVSNYFYVHAKANDKISFEVGVGERAVTPSNPRDAWGRAKWTNLVLTTVTEEVAKADQEKFVDLYDDDDSYMDEYNELLDKAYELIDNPDYDKYPEAAYGAYVDAFEAIISDAVNITRMNVDLYVARLKATINMYLASEIGLKLHYDFANTENDTVPDLSGNGYAGALLSGAKVEKMGEYNVLELGNANGYLDMGKSFGNVIGTMGDYTISSYVRIDESSSITGNGNFLWTFASQAVCDKTVGKYINYRVTNQKYAYSLTGWEKEYNFDAKAPLAKGEWKHVVFKQKGNIAALYVDGVVVVQVDTIQKSTAANPSAVGATVANWIGRPQFSGDSYLKNTKVYDFRVYNYAIEDSEITTMAEKIEDLEYAYNYGGDGDFTALKALIAEYRAIASGADVGENMGQYPEAAIFEFEDAIFVAQDLVDDNKGSQYLIDAAVKKLEDAYVTFMAAAVSIIVTSTSECALESGIYYVKAGKYYLTAPVGAVNNTYLTMSKKLENPELLNNRQTWNVQFNAIEAAANPARYSFVSCLDDNWTTATIHMDELGRVKLGGLDATESTTGDNHIWRNHSIYYNGTAYAIVNVKNNTSLVFKGTENTDGSIKTEYSTSADKKFIFDIVKLADDKTSIKPNSASSSAIVYDGGNMIVLEGINAGSLIKVYDFSGRMLKQVKANASREEINIQKGMYIVKVQTSEASFARKVVIR